MRLRAMSRMQDLGVRQAVRRWIEVVGIVEVRELGVRLRRQTASILIFGTLLRPQAVLLLHILSHIGIVRVSRYSTAECTTRNDGTGQKRPSLILG